ncbi:MAG: hypothetical protein AAF282_02115 [Cyanobacteria bacterium P01_A01_bin.15]
MPSTKETSRIVLRGVALLEAQKIKDELSLSSLSDAIAVMADRYRNTDSQLPTPAGAPPATAITPERPGPMTF